jgi:Domain of unknown function (DUF4157)
MKPSYARRYRRHSSSSTEVKMLKKDARQEQVFFAAPSHESFFKPNVAIQRKCDHCEAEEKKVNRISSEKEDEKKIQKTEEKKEDLHRLPDQQEEKKLQKTEDKKEEIHREAGNKEEEKKLQKMEEKKEEVHRQPDHPEEKKLQKAGDKKEEEKTIAKKENSTAGGSGVTSTGSYIRSLGGKGNTLPKDSIHFFGERMGYNFSNVRIHTGTDAERSAKEVNAKAYTVDNNIVFNKGQYNPASADGKKLLAHELTHVVQQEGNSNGLVSRVAQLTDKKKEEEKHVAIEGKATKTKNKTSHGCGGVEVHGQTDANYKSSFKTSGKSKPSDTCTDCTPPDCITSEGAVISSFKSNPVITLPDVPDGLSKCEAKAVRTFINGTLKRHEQQHKAAFKTYDGTVRTPYSFSGCRAELDSLVQSIHDGIDAQRSTDANALSDALDPFNLNIPCDCKDDQNASSI